MQNKMLSLEESIRLASEYQNSGQLQQAEVLLRNILDKYPNQADALHLLGVVAYQAGQMNMALELIRKAISINDNVALFHSNYGEMCRINKNYKEAIIHGEKAVALDPSQASTNCNLGIAYFDAQEFDRAQTCQMRALSLDPTFPQALNNMGSIFREKKMFVEAMNHYEKAFVASNRQYVEPLCNWATLLIEQDRAEEAFPVASLAIKIQADNPEAWCSLGGIWAGRENPENAHACFLKVLNVVPDHANALAGMARVYQENGQLTEAFNYINKAIELKPDSDNFYIQRAQYYQDIGKIKEAVADFDKSFELKPGETTALASKARLFLELGDMEMANQVFEQGLAIDPKDIGTLTQMIVTYKIKKGDANMATLVELYQSGTITKINERIALNFALGKCYEDVGNYDQAFHHFLEGNALKRQTFDYDPKEDESRSMKIIDTFTADYIKQCEGGGNNTTRPIFIVGMPRSGTTLVEQIISSHPSVFGAGELNYLSLLIADMAASQKKSAEDLMKSLTPETIKQIGNEYLNLIQKLDDKALRVTDKMPNNYVHIGLIHNMFPNAKIVHLQRNPLDVCLSSFSRLFHRGQHHSYDLADQGRHYRDYALIMEHWRKTLPAGAFFDIQYENLIADIEKYARQLIAYCGLEWDEACLDFYNTKRRVRTASIMQVRQPIYKTSVEKWRRYEKYLAPLREALGEFNPE